MEPSAHQPPVLADVARIAGVSISSVSRTLTGRTPVSPIVRAKVEAAVESLGYRPNAAAQALVSGRRSTIAVVARNTLRYGYAAVLQGIEEAARDAGLTVTIAVIESDAPEDIAASLALVLSQPLAGAVVIEFDGVGVAALEALPLSLPVVAVAGALRPQGERPHVFLDDELGGRLATEHLLALGHRTVHHVAIPSTRARSGRSWGWRKALEAAGAEIPELVQADYDPLSGYRAGLTLADRPDVTAVLCGNDEIAIGVARALHEAGRDVPAEVSVVGFDDQPFAQMWVPPLTTVAQDFGELGRRSVELLTGWIDGGSKPADWVGRPTLVTRGSTAPPAGERS